MCFGFAIQASSSRRSHEGSYGGGSDYSNRYGYSEEKGGYVDERGRGYREERRSASSFRDRSREDYPHRKAEQLDSSMPPPSSAPSRHLSSPRGSFRGRISGRGTRGMSRMIFPRRVDTVLKKKSILDSSYTFRKRMLATRSQADNLRRLKLQRLRRIREAALSTKKEGQGEREGSKATEDISDDEDKEENWEEDMDKEQADAGDDEEDDELEEGETPDKKEKTKVKEKKKEAKTSLKDDEREEGEEVDDEEEEEQGQEEDEEGQEEEEEEEEEDRVSMSDTPAPSKKSDVKNDGGVHVTIKQDSDARAVSEEGRKHLPRSSLSGRPFIRLSCPHCFVRCITFKEYTLHLYTSKHINMMRKQSLRHKQTLARMRMSQRQKQRLLEESEEVHGNLPPRSNFCPICKLNYRQLKSKHQASDSHRAMKKFLMPYCRVCRIGFKSPMLYENHICSLDHLKRKARLEERMMRLHDRGRDMEDDDGSGMDEDKELNMENFMILDSVGTVDDTDDEGDGDDGKPRGEKDKKDGEEKKSKHEINLGAEYVKKIEVYFCDLCRLYLPRLDQPERALAIHCRTRTHLQRYVRYRDDRALRNKAEKIHHRKEAAKENAVKEAEAKKNLEVKPEGEVEKKDDGASSSVEKETTGKASDNGAGTEAINKKNSTDGTAKLSQEGRDTSMETTADGGGEGDGDLDQDLESGMDDKLWADVDKDLGELLREVEPGNKSSDEDDDSRAEGGRYDRFRYSEKGSTVTADPSSEGDVSKAAAEADETVEKSDAGKDKQEVTNAKLPGEDKLAVNDVPAAGAVAAAGTTDASN